MLARFFVGAVLGLWAASGATARAAELKPTKVEPPVVVSFSLALNDAQQIAGEVVSYDAAGFKLRAAGVAGEVDYKWKQLTWPSEYHVRMALIDKNKGADWIAMADLAVKNKLLHQVKPCVTNAVKLDPSLKLKGDAILRAAIARGTVVKFQKVTPEEHAKAIAEAREAADVIAKELKFSFTTIETAHFLVVTDWPQHEHQYLTDLCEEAYKLVSKEFDIPVQQNVFVGKLPIFMLASQEGFARFAHGVDGFPKPVSPNLAGYFAKHDDNSGHMAMYRPDRDPEENDPKGMFAFTLVHEFCHAFVARYRTNQHVPRWLNEGVAEYIAYKKYPRKIAYPFALHMAGQRFTFTDLFDDNKMPGGDMYPVMQTMVEALIKENPRGFIRMFNDIKDGVEPQVAMQKVYKATYADFEPAWRRYAKALKTPYRIVTK